MCLGIHFSLNNVFQKLCSKEYHFKTCWNGVPWHLEHAVLFCSPTAWLPFLWPWWAPFSAAISTLFHRGSGIAYCSPFSIFSLSLGDLGGFNYELYAQLCSQILNLFVHLKITDIQQIKLNQSSFLSPLKHIKKKKSRTHLIASVSLLPGQIPLILTPHN